ERDAFRMHLERRAQRQRIVRRDIARPAGRQTDNDILDHGLLASPCAAGMQKTIPGDSSASRQIKASGLSTADNQENSLGVPVGSELLEVGPQIADLLLVLDAGEDHLGAGDLGARIADVFLERVLAPGDAGVLVGLGVIVALDAARMAAIE